MLLSKWFLQPESRWDFLSHFFLNQSISKNVGRNSKSHSCKVHTHWGHIFRTLAVSLCQNIMGGILCTPCTPWFLRPWVRVRHSRSFFLDPVQRISTRSYVSQCQLIYSVITTAISLILGLFPAEILLLMCFCHIKHHHDVAVFCHHFSFSRLHIFAPGLFVSSRF